MSPGSKPRDLETYRRKRSPEATPEPFDDAAPAEAGAPLRFVVQQHAARRLHWDLRLEWGGVLLSWAVPQGPSFDPADKRLAVQTEDHPLDYTDFEGVIPQGQYGGGAMIVWDRGRWLPVEDPEAGLAKGKLLFELRGYKLRGVWTLVKIKKSARDWLLIKERDSWAQKGGREVGQGSVFSGLTVQELGAGSDRAEAVRRRIRALRAPAREIDPAALKFMLAETAPKPFSRAGWLFEMKHDGYRLLAAKRPAPPTAPPKTNRMPDRQPSLSGPRAALYLRSGQEGTRTFPEIARAMAALPYRSLLLDGEAVVLDEAGRPRFGRLQKRGQLQRVGDIERTALEYPVTYFVFDLLAFEDWDLRGLPLLERKALLRELLPADGPLRYSDHIEERGVEFFREVAAHGLEGVMAKRAASTYVPGRSADWQKVRASREDDFVVVGYTLPQGSRSGLGALHLGAYADDGRLVYVGRAGTGFKDRELAAFERRLLPRRQAQPACVGEIPKGREHVWVEPELVVSVRFTERTEAGLLRHPVFLRLRDDKPMEDCRLDGEGPLPGAARTANGVPPPSRSAAEPGTAAADTAARKPAAAKREVRFSNLDKVFWPAEGYTKGDLIDYYRAVAPWLLPYLRDRPLVLDRYPDGVGGKSFYQKDAPAGTPDWVRTVAIRSEDGGRDIDYFLCQDVETLLHVANLGTIPLHVWASRVERIERPDWSILDLDPKDAPFTSVVAVARRLRELCQEIGLEPFLKTSGSSGLHVLLPLGGQLGFEQARQLAEVLARVVVRDLPKIATVERVIAARGGRVYLDYLQNGHGKLLVAPFSVRPKPGAKVSMPLRWSEATARLDPAKYTIKTAIRRLEKLGDPLAPVLELEPDLAQVLARLSGLHG